MPEAERYFVLGTAGHIDHGKTSLVKALTGQDCDRLAEEKERGITIDLGFAHWALPDGARLAIIDMPGHRRFIRNMVAGASGIDLVLLIVAADDGVMPQTIEHLQICRLLGVRHGLVALTKCDLVEPELLELARADVEAHTAGSFLEGAPIVPVSSVTKQGLPELTTALMAACRAVEASQPDAPLRLPIDRAFTIKGAGTVITGTILAGTIHVDDELELLPRGLKVRVRGLQMHGSAQQAIGPRHRTAVNLVGVDKEQLSRGDVLCAPGSLLPTALLDVRLELLPGKRRPLRTGSWAELHLGTAEVGVKLVPLEADEVAAGQSALAQLRLDDEIACSAGDRFILRGPGGDQTVGGGVVLDAHPTVHRRHRTAAAASLGALAEELEGELTATQLASALRHEILKTPYGLTRADALQRLNAGESALEAAIAYLREHGGLASLKDGRSEHLSLEPNRERLAAAIEKALATYHSAHPLTQRGMTQPEIAQALSAQAGRLPGELVAQALGLLAGLKKITEISGSWALAGRVFKLGERDKKAIALIEKTLEASMSPDQPEDILALLEINKERLRQVLDYLREAGSVMLAPGGIFFSAARAEQARQALREYLSREPGAGQGITVSDFNKLIGTSRKYGMPLLHLFEQEGWLSRDGDLRRLK